MRASFVLQDQTTFASMQGFLENPRLYELYPQTLMNLLVDLFFVGESPKAGMWKTGMAALRALPIGEALGDLWRMRRL